jgi:hypothetical protein
MIYLQYVLNYTSPQCFLEVNAGERNSTKMKNQSLLRQKVTFFESISKCCSALKCDEKSLFRINGHLCGELWYLDNLLIDLKVYKGLNSPSSPSLRNLWELLAYDYFSQASLTSLGPRIQVYLRFSSLDWFIVSDGMLADTFTQKSNIWTVEPNSQNMNQFLSCP